jgi:transposase InsO family protein
MKPEDLDLMRKIDELYIDDPSRGSRSIRRQLRCQGIRVNRKRIQRLMRLMGIEAVYPKGMHQKTFDRLWREVYMLESFAAKKISEKFNCNYDMITISQ